MIDGTGSPVKDVLLEIWQANAAGIYAHPADRRSGEVEAGFRGWGRVISDFDTGLYGFDTVKPGAVPGRNGRPMAPHLNLWIVARGINIGLNTRMYFADEAEANADGPGAEPDRARQPPADADRRPRAARRQAGLPLRHPAAGRGRDRVPRRLMVAALDHPWLAGLVGDAEIAALIGPEAELAAMLAFETALAEAEAGAGVIPPDAAAAIAAALAGFRPDMAALAAATARDGVVVPELVRQLRAAVGEPHAARVHFGATSQDVIDTALVLRLKAAAPGPRRAAGCGDRGARHDSKRGSAAGR